MATELVSLTMHITGFFDTGRSNVTVGITRSHYDPTERPGKQVTDREEVWSWKAEVFMTEGAQDYITSRLLKAIDAYATEMML